ncbi:MAG: hypothetical protein LUF00_06640 [Lachnospiraceae bacterium]|nr:hypothetical protein [Lachnospiraceae bacterium]
MEEGRDLDRLLSSFSCEQDDDIESFLHKRAVEFEKLSKSRTYLVFDQEQLENASMDNQPLKIYGYISLALKILTVPETTSNRIRKDLDGFSSKIHGTLINDFPCYLIGQLSRASNVPKESLSGKQLVDFAYDVITAAVNSVGGRYMMIECHDNEKLIQFYEKNSFRVIARVPDEDKPMVQMICKIENR